MSDGGGSAGRRLGLVTIDQLISGGSNVLIALIAARLLSAADFGLFGIVFLIYTLLVAITRALVSDPLLIHPEESQGRPGEAIGTTCMLAVPLTLVAIAIGIVVDIWSPTLGNALVILAVCLPLLLLQDLGRYLAFATQRPKRAVVLDSVWLALMLVAVAVVFSVTDDRSLGLLIAAWGGAGALSGLLLFTMYSHREIRLGLDWLRYTWHFSWRFLVTYIAQQGSALGVAGEVGAIAGAKALGGVQGALLLGRPFTTFQVAATTQAIAETARCANDRRCVWRHVLVASGMAGGVAALNMAFMLAIPDGIGTAFLGDSWGPAQPLLLPTGLFILAIGLTTGPAAGLLGLRAVGKVTAISVVTAIVAIAVAAVGAVINGAVGAMWFSAGARGAMMVVFWVVLTVHMRRPVLRVATDPPATVIAADARSSAPVSG